MNQDDSIREEKKKQQSVKPHIFLFISLSIVSNSEFFVKYPFKVHILCHPIHKAYHLATEIWERDRTGWRGFTKLKCIFLKPKET